jgi:hypothetical protein
MVAFGHGRDYRLSGFVAEKRSVKFRVPEAVSRHRAIRAHTRPWRKSEAAVRCEASRIGSGRSQCGVRNPAPAGGNAAKAAGGADFLAGGTRPRAVIRSTGNLLHSPPAPGDKRPFAPKNS